MKRIRFLFLLFLTIKGIAQNMIPNQSFEQISHCPRNFNDFPVKQWFSATIGTPDVYSDCSLTTFGVPKNWAGIKNPVHGNKYIGIFLSSNPKDTNFSEYAYCKLNEPLTYNKEYHLEFYASPSTHSKYGTNILTVAFSDTILIPTTKHHLTFPNHIKINTQNAKEENGWYKFNITFTAIGTAQYFYLGNFLETNNSLFEREIYEGYSPMLAQSAYYYFDNFWLEPKTLTQSTIFSYELEQPFSIQNLYFDFDQYEVKINDSTQLNNLINYLMQNPNYMLQIFGYTDSKGSNEYNMMLSEKRASQVKKILNIKGIENKRISVFAKGEFYIEPLNDTEKRKVVFKITRP